MNRLAFAGDLARNRLQGVMLTRPPGGERATPGPLKIMAEWHGGHILPLGGPKYQSVRRAVATIPVERTQYAAEAKPPVRC